MATPIRYVVYDIQTDLKQSFDNRLVGIPQILYWVTIIGNRLKYQHISKLLNKGSWIPGKYLNIFSGIPVQTSVVSVNPNIVKDRKYIKVPATIMDLDYESGVEYITYDIGASGCCNEPPFTMVGFSPTTPGGAAMLYGDPYTKPSPQNPYFYRVHDYLYLLGIECVNVSELEIGIYTYADPHLICDLDGEIDLPDHLIPVLKKEVLNLGVFALKIPQDITNDGSSIQKIPVTLRQGQQVNPAQTTTQQVATDPDTDTV